MRKAIAVVGLVASGVLGYGCSGDDGAQGAQGEPGPKGAQGEQGPKGDKGDPGMDGTSTGMAGAGNTDYLQTSCLTPCHGFTGIVEQWKTSTHYSAYVANLNGDEVESWTGAKSCANCHAIDGIAYRLDGDVTVSGTGSMPPEHVEEGQITYKKADGTYSEAVYNGHASVAVVHCTTCHSVNDATDPHKTGKAVYETDDFPLRVPAAAGDNAYIEKSSEVGASDGTAVSYGKGNACVWCHKSRKDVTNYITASNKLSGNWGPHEGPHSDVFTGKGGYSFTGREYSAGSHSVFANGCVKCHMPGADDFNMGIGDHSFKPQLSVCKECHASASSFDIGGHQSQTEINLQQLRVLLNTDGLLTREELAGAPLGPDELSDTEFASDEASNATNVPKDVAGALYNYLMIARGSALGVHNPPYVDQLIWDSIDLLDNDVLDESVVTFARPEP